MIGFVSHFTVVKDVVFIRCIEIFYIPEDLVNPSLGLILGPIRVLVAVCENDAYVFGLYCSDGFLHDQYVLHV